MLQSSSKLKIKFKKLVENAFTPTRGTESSAGYDLYCIDGYKNLDFEYIEFGTGLAIQIPEGYVGLVFPRSSISKTSHTLINSIGVIDSDYRGEIKLRLSYKDNKEHLEYQYGDRIGQLIIMPYPEVEYEEVTDLSTSSRGAGGFGHTGK